MSALNFIIGPAIFLIVVVVIIYLVKRNKTSEDPKFTYFFFFSFITMAILYWAFSDLSRIILDKYISPIKYQSLYQSEKFLRSIAGRLSAILVAFPLWAFHWSKANPVNERMITEKSKKTYAIFTVFCSMIGVLIFWPVLIYFLMTWALGVSDSNLKEALPSLFSYGLPITALWIIHFRMWKKLSDKPKNESPVVVDSEKTII